MEDMPNDPLRRRRCSVYGAVCTIDVGPGRPLRYEIVEAQGIFIIAKPSPPPVVICDTSHCISERQTKYLK